MHLLRLTARKEYLGQHLIVRPVLLLEDQRPIWAADIKRIQDHISSPGIVVRLDELTGRVVDDRRLIIAPGELFEKTMDDLRFSAPDIAQNQHSLRLLAALHPQPPGRLITHRQFPCE